MHKWNITELSDKLFVIVIIASIPRTEVKQTVQRDFDLDLRNVIEAKLVSVFA